MKKKFFTVLLLFSALGFISAQTTVSGIFDSTVTMNVKAGDPPAFTCGIEEYANIRIQSRFSDEGTIYGAINFIAASGDSAFLLAGSGIPISENFIAAIEIERLYFRLFGEYTDFDGGLMRLPFGYGNIFGSKDFLNPRNPLKPDARARAVLGAALTWYPADELKLLCFYSAPRDPFSNKGEGSFFGITLDNHWGKASVQALYSYETPNTGSKLGIHRIGLSLKADLIAGFAIDTLYTYNHEAETALDGLSFSIGADYSFFDGDLMVLAEYLYNGETSSTAFSLEKNIMGFPNRHYLYTGLTLRLSDFAILSGGLLTCFDDTSFTPIITINYDLFQGAVFAFSLQAPFDSDSFSGVSCTAKLRLRF